MVLERVGSGLPGLRCTTQPALWLGGEAELFVWEAFVSGTGKPVPLGISQHAADAAAAADTFANRLEEESLSASDVVCAPATSFNLAARRGHPHVKVVKLNRLQESAVGGDYLWWWLDRSSSLCFGLLVQAKRLTRSGTSRRPPGQQFLPPGKPIAAQPAVNDTGSV